MGLMFYWHNQWNRDTGKWDFEQNDSWEMELGPLLHTRHGLSVIRALCYCEILLRTQFIISAVSIDPKIRRSYKAK